MSDDAEYRESHRGGVDFLSERASSCTNVKQTLKSFSDYSTPRTNTPAATN